VLTQILFAMAHLPMLAEDRSVIRADRPLRRSTEIRDAFSRACGDRALEPPASLVISSYISFNEPRGGLASPILWKTDSSALRHPGIAEGKRGGAVAKKDYQPLIDRQLEQLKTNEVMRDLHSFDPRDSAERAGEFFHMMADLVNDQPDSPVAKLFHAADLNHEHPFAWGYLLMALAEIHFVRRKRGRPKIQDDAFKRKLRAIVSKIVKTRNKPPNDNHLATLLKERYGQDYPTITSIPGFNSLLRRHKIKSANVWAKSKSRKNTRRTRSIK
jgi:hypothetical protein